MTDRDNDGPASRQDVRELRQALADLPSPRFQAWVGRVRRKLGTWWCGCGFDVPVHMRRDNLITCAERWQSEPLTPAQWDTIVARFVRLVTRLTRRRRLRKQLLGAVLVSGTGLSVLLWWLS